MAAASDTGRHRARQIVLSVSLLAIGLGLVVMGFAKGRRLASKPLPAPPMTIYTAPPVAAVVPTPAGEIAWESHARSPLVTALNGDGVEDFVGFFRVWDGRSAWIAHVGAFDGASLQPIWMSEPIDPQLVKRRDAVPFAVVVAGIVVVADASSTLRMFQLKNGEKLLTLKLSDPVAEVCPAPDGGKRIWVAVTTGAGSFIDLATGASDSAPRPKWCPPLRSPPELRDLAGRASAPELDALAKRRSDTAHCAGTFLNDLVSLTQCHAPDGPRWESGFEPAYELTDGIAAVAFGVKGGKPFAASRSKNAMWERDLSPDTSTAKPIAAAVTEVAFGRVYAVYEKVYFDARLVSLNAKSGETLWESPLVGSLPGPDGPGRGEARSLTATASRVYVARAGGSLDVFDASTGKPVGIVGKH